jgi:hypothetical protein
MLRLLPFLAALSLAGGVFAQTVAGAPKGGAPVYCGSFTCFALKAPALGKDPDSRAVHAMDIINKYLGGKAGKVTLQESGKYVRILLNNEMVVTVTADDAANEKVKTPKLLAEKWAKKLSLAFDASKAQPG